MTDRTIHYLYCTAESAHAATIFTCLITADHSAIDRQRSIAYMHTAARSIIIATGDLSVADRVFFRFAAVIDGQAA